VVRLRFGFGLERLLRQASVVDLSAAWLACTRNRPEEVRTAEDWLVPIRCARNLVDFFDAVADALRACMITARARIAAGQTTAADMPGLLAQAFAIAEAGCPRPRA
jgi:hypothetical protein